MASGIINLGISNQIEGRISWSSASNGSAANSSNVSATISVRRTNSYTTTGTWGITLNIGGTEKTHSYLVAVSNSWVDLYNFSITKTHNADGTGSCYIGGSIQGPSGTSQANSKVSGNATVALDLIPRAATITSASNFTDEGTPTLGYSNPAGNNITSLQACIASEDGKTIYVAYRDINKTGTSYSFSLTTNERNLLRNLCSTSNSMTVKYYLKTVIGGDTYYNSVSKTLSIINAAPTLSPTVKDTGSVSITLTGDANNKFIKGYNAMEVAANAVIRKGASLKSISVSCGSKSISSGSGTLSNVENDTFVFTVTDSRGNTAKQEVKKTMLSYVTLTCNLDIEPPTTSGDLSFTVRGNYFNGSFGSKSNTLTVEYRYKENSGSWSAWTTLTATKSGNTYSATQSITGLNYLNSYTFQARAKDIIYNGSSEAAKTTPEKQVKTTPVFDWSADDFRINVPLTVEGVNLGGFMRAITNTYNLSTSVTKGANYSSVTTSNAVLLGNCLRCNFSATRSSSISAGNVTNETVCSFTINHGGKIKSAYRVDFGNGTTGGLASFTITNAKNTDTTLTFDVVLAANGTAGTGFNTYFMIPVVLNLDAF